MEIQHCVRCGKGLKAPQGINQTGDPAIAIYVIAKTVGVRPRATSPAQRKVFCVPCGVSIAQPVPDSRALMRKSDVQPGCFAD
jgi:ribosomal protein S27E